jgi:hypothetical protein
MKYSTEMAVCLLWFTSGIGMLICLHIRLTEECAAIGVSFENSAISRCDRDEKENQVSSSARGELNGIRMQ